MLCCFDCMRPKKDTERRCYTPVDSGITFGRENQFIGGYPYQNPGSYNPQQIFIPAEGNVQQTFNSSLLSNEVHMMNVIVPDGVYPGQILHVAVPDGSGRLVAVTVPPGASSGETFIVEFPLASNINPNLAVTTPIYYSSQPIQQQIVSSTAATPYYPSAPNQPIIQAQQPYYASGQRYYNESTTSYHASTGEAVAPIIAGVAGVAMLAGAAGLAYEALRQTDESNGIANNTYNGDNNGGDPTVDDDGGDFGGGGDY